MAIETIRKKKIKVTPGVRKELAELMGWSFQSVYEALSYNNNSEKCMQCRKLALEKGGVEVVETILIEG